MFKYKIIPFDKSYQKVVDVHNESAKIFYLRYGFQKLIDYDNRLFLPLTTVSNIE